MQIEEIYKIYQQYPSVQTDTRKLKKDDLFFALKGPNFNGNLFAKQALEKGAAYVFADEITSFNHERIIHTNNALETLQQLAKFHRQQFNTFLEKKAVFHLLLLPAAMEKQQPKNWYTKYSQQPIKPIQLKET